MGKPHNPLDRGAVFKAPMAQKSKNESDCCLFYATFAYHLLTNAGYHPFLVTSGSYGQRAIFSNQINADLYLACHLNSSQIPPRKNHAIVEISELAGKTTCAFAEHLIEDFRQTFCVEGDVRIIKKNQRGWACINRVKAPALLLEPCFGNHPEGFKLAVETPWKIASSIQNSRQIQR